MDESPQLRHILIPIFVGMFTGITLGLIGTWGMTIQEGRQYWLSGFGCIGILAGWGLSAWLITKRKDWVFYEFRSTQPVEQKVIEKVTLVIRTPGLSDRLIHGLTYEELILIGECVTAKEHYEFDTQQFKDYFRGSGTDGYSLYKKSVRWMKDCGALVPNAKGGTDVTDIIGVAVFEAMRDENWDEVERLSESPTLTR